MITISPEVAVAIALAVLGSFYTLIRIIRYLDAKRNEDAKKALEKQVDDLQKQVRELEGQIKGLEAKQQAVVLESQRLEQSRQYFDRTLEQLQKTHGDDVKTIFARLDVARETLSDMRETLAGFGSNYVSRKEYLDDKNRKHA